MPKKIIIHAVDINGDGYGDLIYLMHWIKVFNKYYKGTAEQRVLMLASDPDQISKFLLSIAESEPKHHIFKFFSIESAVLKPTIVSGIKIGALQRSQREYFVILQDYFPDIQNNDHITLVCISTGWNQYRKTSSMSSIPIERVFGIFEFDALIAPHATKTMVKSSLGLEPNDFGLLHDINGITGSESLEPYFDQLSTTVKKQMFQNSDITYAEAEEFLTTVPSVFAYIVPFCLHYTLHAALSSSIIQEAIAAGKKPIFFITANSLAIDLPPSLIVAAKENEIRIVRAWLDNKDFQAVNAIFMNRKTRSIVIPSGDNSLTQCIKSGKFPLYAHKPTIHDSEFQFNFKCGVFKSMLGILNEKGIKHGWDKHSGFTPCLKTLAYLARKPRNAGIRAHYNGMQEHISTDMLTFFSEILAPYLMDNFAFERKSFPKLLKMIQEEKALVAKQSTTVQFDQVQHDRVDHISASGTLIDTPSHTVKDAKPTTTPKTSQGSFPGLKAGFLL